MKIWIRENDGQVCEVYHGAEKPHGCEAPGKWSQVDQTSKKVFEFLTAQEAKFSAPTKQSKLLAALTDPSVTD